MSRVLRLDSRIPSSCLVAITDVDAVPKVP